MHLHNRSPTCICPPSTHFLFFGELQIKYPQTDGTKDTPSYALLYNCGSGLNTFLIPGLGDNDVYWPPLPFKSHHGAGLEGDGRGGGGRGGDVSNVVNELTLTTFNGTA